MRRGKYRTISAAQGSGLYVYERYQGDKHIRIMLNMDKRPQDIEIFLQKGKTLLGQGIEGTSLASMGYLMIK